MTDEQQASATRSPTRTSPPSRVPYIESLGVELLEMADGKAVAVMTPKPEHLNSWDVVHGGVLMTLLDFAMAMAGRSAWRPRSGAPVEAADGDASASPGARGAPSASPEQDEARNLTVEMKTSFLRPARGRLIVTGRCLQAGRSLSFCEAEITDADGAPIARASGTFKFWSNR
jgi:acyl-coenzyme A thioesterase PaaI-like protein